MAVQTRVGVTIQFTKEDTQPPIYVAGSFSEPAWEPLEMQYEVRENVYHYYREVEVDLGKKYQYKFRIGTGDWWMLNENLPTITDDAGNQNNLLMVARGDVPSDSSLAREGPHSATNDLHLPYAEPGAVNRGDPAWDHLITLDGQRTPDVAAEVADTAQALDQTPPTPPISDEEAGRTGYRRMSSTPIPEVAQTAAQVADTAARLDGSLAAHTDLPTLPIFGIATPGKSTPREEQAPRFEHEKLELPSAASQGPTSPRDHKRPRKTGDDGPFDPIVEDSPPSPKQILEQVRTMSDSLPEDDVNIEGAPLSPVGMTAERNASILTSPSPLPHLLSSESPSLVSIPEEGKRPLLADTTTGVRSSSRSVERSGLSESQEYDFTSQLRTEDSPDSAGDQQAHSNAPAADLSLPDTAHTTAQGSTHTLLKKRGAPQPEQAIERSSTTNLNEPAQHKSRWGSLVKSIIRTIFVDWVGGLLARLCGKARAARD